MTLSAAGLRRLAARAAPLHERLRGPYHPSRARGAAAIATERIDRWIELLGGDPRLFERRLALDGLDRASTRRLVGEVVLPRDAPLPGWAATLVSACTLIGRVEPPAATTMAFPEAIEPFVAHARATLHAAVPAAAMASLRPEIVGVLADQLRQRLSAVAGRSLLLGLRHRVARGSLDPGAPSDAPGHDGYRDYTSTLANGGLVELLQESPVLARQLAVLTDAWISATSTWVRHVAADQDALRAWLDSNHALGPVEAVSPTLSTPHDGGRSVLMVTFASGLTLVYKPRDLEVAQQLRAVLSWLASHMEGHAPLGLSVLSRNDHGWMEHARARPCEDVHGATRFYHRAGTLLCVLGLLGAIDMHAANLIADGEDPRLVDLETLLHPGGPATVAEAVSATGMLPTPATQVGEHADMSGLGGDPDRPMLVRVGRWTHLGEDRIDFSYGPATTPPLHNAPVVEGRATTALEHADAVQESFERAYDVMLAHREVLRQVLGGLARRRVCLMLRPAQAYGSLQDRLAHPRFMRDGIERSIEIDRLAAPLLAPEAEAWWPSLRAEHAALERGDVPRFRAWTNGEGIQAHGERPFSCPGPTPFERLMQRVAAMSIEDRDAGSAQIAERLRPSPASASA